MKTILAALVLVFGLSVVASASSPTASNEFLLAKVNSLERRIDSLSAEVDEIRAEDTKTRGLGLCAIAMTTSVKSARAAAARCAAVWEEK